MQQTWKLQMKVIVSASLLNVVGGKQPPQSTEAALRGPAVQSQGKTPAWRDIYTWMKPEVIKSASTKPLQFM